MRKRCVLLTAAALALGGGGVAEAAPSHTVPGNNGTVKATVTDGGCVVTVDWYGMDANAESDVELRLHGPSGDAVLLTDTVVLDGDGAIGGDHDGSRSYDLNNDIVTHGDPDADWHLVKLTTHTTVSHGADVKHKVVKVSGCEEQSSGNT